MKNNRRLPRNIEILDDDVLEDELIESLIFAHACSQRKEQLTDDFFNVEEELELYIGEL